MIDFVQSGQGKVDDFLAAIAYWDQKISIAILGSTLTSQVDRGSNTEALGKIHEQMRLELIDSDAAQIAPTLTQQLLAPIAVANGLFAPGRMPRFAFDLVEPVDATAWVGVMQTGAALGMRIPLDWAHAKLQIPQAGKDDAVLQVGAATPGSAPAGLRVALATMTGGREVDPLAERLIREAGAIESAYVDRLYRLVSEAGDLDAAQAALLAVAKERDLQNNLVDKVGDATLAAHLSGRVG